MMNIAYLIWTLGIGIMGLEAAILHKGNPVNQIYAILLIAIAIWTPLLTPQLQKIKKANK